MTALDLSTGWPARLDALFGRISNAFAPPEPCRQVRAAHRLDCLLAVLRNRMWAMDFVSDAPFDGRRFRVFPSWPPFPATARRSTSTRAFAAMTRWSSWSGYGFAEEPLPTTSGSIRPRIRPEGAGPLGLPEWRGPGLLTAWEVDRQCRCGGLQGAVSGRVPDHALLLEPGRCLGQDRGVAAGRQRDPSSDIAWCPTPTEFASSAWANPGR